MRRSPDGGPVADAERGRTSLAAWEKCQSPEWALVHECESRISLWDAVQDFIDPLMKTTPLPMYCSTNSGRPQGKLA